MDGSYILKVISTGVNDGLDMGSGGHWFQDPHRYQNPCPFIKLGSIYIQPVFAQRLQPGMPARHSRRFSAVLGVWQIQVVCCGTFWGGFSCPFLICGWLNPWI